MPQIRCKLVLGIFIYVFFSTGCARSFHVLEPVEHDGFHFQIVETQTTSVVGQFSGVTTYKWFLRGQFTDAIGGRLASAASRIQLTEVRDEKGNDLIELSRKNWRHSASDDAIAFPRFVDPHGLKFGPGIQQYPTARFEQLPTKPVELKLLRGYASVLEATKQSSHDIRVQPMSERRELSQGLSFRIVSIEPRGKGRLLTFEVETAPVEGALSEAQFSRWYNFETLDANGNHLEDFPNAVLHYNSKDTSSFTGNIPLDLEPREVRVETLRITVIDEMRTFNMPFEYRDVALE
jgi:hypothetical protein